MNGVFSFFRLRPHDDGSIERGRMGRILIDDEGLHHLEDYHGGALRELPPGPLSAETKDRLARMMHSPYIDVRAWDDHLGDGDPVDVPEEELEEPMVPDVQALPGLPPSIFQYSRVGMDGMHIVEAHGDQLLLDGQPLSPEESKAILGNVHVGAAILRYHRPPPKGTPHIPGTPDYMGKAEYPQTKAGAKVSGLMVGSKVDNQNSIGATFGRDVRNVGLREVPMDHFDPTPPKWWDDAHHAKVDEIVNQIQESGRIDPLIVAVSHEGPDVLEGAHRLRALHRLGARSFPAMVVYHGAAIKKTETPEKLVGDTIKKDPMVPRLGNLYALEERHQKDEGRAAVVAIDLNDFWRANEVGWREADEAIVAFGEALAKAAGGDAYRDGGDGFVAFCDTKQDAYAMLRELTEALKELPAIGGSYRMTLSAGVGETLDRARAALSIAKQSKYRGSSDQAEDSVYTAGSDNLIS